MSKARNPRPWTKHFGLPQIPIVITNPKTLVQIEEDGVRGRCRVAPANDVDWERVTKWRLEDESGRDHADDADDLSFQECADERRRIAEERAKVEAALTMAKRDRDAIAIRDLGHRIQTMAQRASIVKVRQTMLATKSNGDALKQACKELLPPDLLLKIYDRANMIQKEMLR
ncbi:hypothetical protein [Sphingobium yanoikuyae]|nr:hypothetical protein [Sphingobium yanoikuyae]